MGGLQIEKAAEEELDLPVPGTILLITFFRF
jgi:hypothetical protein